MGPVLVVPVDPVPNDPPCLLKRLERVLPDTLVFQASKEPLNQPIPLGRIGCTELLLQPIVSTGLAKPAALENQPVIAAEHRRVRRPERAEALETGGFDGALGFLRPTS